MLRPLLFVLCACCCPLVALASDTASPRPASEPPAPVILVLGDSLSAAHGLPRERGWVWLLGERLRALGHPHQVINASISGETTDGGLSRLPALLARHAPDLLLIELGANDGLRGQPLERPRANLTAIIARAGAAGARSLLIGVTLPPNYGATYTQGFQAVFSAVATATGTPLVPDLLAGVAEDRALMQDDGLHPTAAAQPRILETVWSGLAPLLGDDP